MAETVSCTVIGPCPIVGADGKDVNPGGVVELDPDITNIPALIEGGHIRMADTATTPNEANEAP